MARKEADSYGYIESTNDVYGLAYLEYTITQRDATTVIEISEAGYLAWIRDSASSATLNPHKVVITATDKSSFTSVAAPDKRTITNNSAHKLETDCLHYRVSQDRTYLWEKTHAAQTKYIDVKIEGKSQSAHLPVPVPAKTSYTITYNANGGSGAPASQTKWYNETLKLQTGIPTKSGYTFLGWSTSSTATSATYAAGANYTANSAATLYAIWRKTITLTYDANGGSGAPSSQTGYAYNSNTSVSLTISSTKPTKTGYTCIGWSTSSTATTPSYNFSTAYSFSANTKLYAVWKANQYSISYNNNGGSGTITAQTKTYNSALTLSNGSGFSRTGSVNGVGVEYELLRWNTKADGTGTNYALSGSAPNITQNLTLYAVWAVKYVYPTISNLTVKRTATSSASDTTEADDGEYLLITFDWTACSEDGGTTTITPACQITIGSHQYTPTLTSNFSFKPTDVFSQDESFEVTVLLYDADHTTARASARATVPTAILPIDMYGDNNGVYMGIMHKYESGQTLTLPSTYVDGDIILEIDPNGATTNDAALYTALHNMGWI